jgi:hypothetical protein
MTGQGSLWDYAAERQRAAEQAEQTSRDRTRRQSITRLRASGHWLTLLRIARTIPQPFTLNDISVAVWRANPDVFGMRGYPYPDNHKVHYILYGSRGLIAKGIIKRVREGLFRVPDALDAVELPADEAGTDPAPGPAHSGPDGQADPGFRSVASP